MDPLSTAATVLSVIGVAIRVGRETYILVQGARTAPAYIQRLATEMQGLYTLLATFQRLLENHRNQRDQIITDMLENLHTTLCDCIEVFKDIKKIMSPFLDDHGDAVTGRWRGFLWATFKKDDVTALLQTLGSYRAMLNMSFSALSVSQANASHTDDVVVKIDENTSQIKGNIENMQSNASQVDARLKVLQRAVQKLERHLDDQEREDPSGEGETQVDQCVDGQASPSANSRPDSNRISVASYNSSLRRSLRDLNSIISSSSAMSRMPSMLISAIPELAEMDDPHHGERLKQERSLERVQESDAILEDDKKYRAFIEETLAGLNMNKEPVSEGSKTPTVPVGSRKLREQDVKHIDNRMDFDETSEGRDWDSKAGNTPAISSWDTLDDFRLLPSPSNYLQNPRPSPLPLGLHRRQVSESAVEAIRKPESKTPTTPTTVELRDLMLMDLKEGIEDWKGHNVESFGNLLLHEILVITPADKPSNRRSYHVYLFEHILLCCKAISPKTKKGFWRLKKSDTAGPQLLRLQLKGRIFLSNISDLIPHTNDGPLTMQVLWKGDRDEESFFIHFDDQLTMYTWIWHIKTQSEACKPAVENPFLDAEGI